MKALLLALPLLPALGFVLLALFGGSLSRRAVAAIGCGVVAGAALLWTVLAVGYGVAPPPGEALRANLALWLAVGGVQAAFSFTLDPLSLVLSGVVTLVGFFIHLHAAETMRSEAGYSRFFAYFNLFITCMLVLVLADNLLLLFLGWEGVGLCSYLLIGFWYEKNENGRAATKAFLVTRLGDVGLLVGMLWLFAVCGTLDIAALNQVAPESLTAGTATMIALLIFLGAAGKSAQLPFQVWLPDAMAGPSPVSALIHAATMVTAGVYLLARLHPLFLLAPEVLGLVALLGGAGALLAALAAAAQRDLKRVLAYSTVSQLGLMFVALGVGAWRAAIFHLVVHAFFKALLFLAAGVVSDSLHHELNLLRMGGLRRRLPAAHLSFLAGAASLTALPLITAGFYSKDAILWGIWASSQGGLLLLGLALATSLITGWYSFRAYGLVFLGPAQREPHDEHDGVPVRLSLTVLSLGALASGLLSLPHLFGGSQWLETFLGRLLPGLPASSGALPSLTAEAAVTVGASLVALLGAGLGWWRYHAGRPATPPLSGLGEQLRRVLESGWGFDWVYARLFVRPFWGTARRLQPDPVEQGGDLAARLSLATARVVTSPETGGLRLLLLGLLIGALLGVSILLGR